jgi:hypothetical protein
VIDMVGALTRAQSPIRVTLSAAVGHGNKTDEGTTTLPSATKFNPVALAESPETQTLTPVTTEEASDIVTNCKIWFCGSARKLKHFICQAIDPSLLAARCLRSSQRGCLCFRNMLPESRLPVIETFPNPGRLGCEKLNGRNCPLSGGRCARYLLKTESLICISL